MNKLSDKMYKLIEEFIQIERELTKQKAKLGTGGVFFDSGYFQEETPNIPDGGSMEILTTLECVHSLLEDYEREQ